MAVSLSFVSLSYFFFSFGALAVYGDRASCGPRATTRRPGSGAEPRRRCNVVQGGGVWIGGGGSKSPRRQMFHSFRPAARAHPIPSPATAAAVAATANRAVQNTKQTAHRYGREPSPLYAVVRPPKRIDMEFTIELQLYRILASRMAQRYINRWCSGFKNAKNLIAWDLQLYKKNACPYDDLIEKITCVGFYYYYDLKETCPLNEFGL